MDDNAKQEILQAVNGLSGRMDKHEQEVLRTMNGISNTLENRMDRHENEVMEAIGSLAEQMDQRFDRVENCLTGVEQRLTRVESTMVTKSYLDDKLGDLKGDMVKFVRAEDAKILAKMK